MKANAPQLNALIKIHKTDQPIRPVINNIQAPSYKLAQHLNKKLNQLIKLPFTYTIKNSAEIAQELNKIRITNQQKIVTMDLYVNLPIHNIINITKFWLNKNNNQNIIVKQTIELIKVILNQNYFQYDDKYYKPIQDIAMGSPLSGTLTEIYLQYFEEMMIKHWVETGEITCYRRYVDDIIIIFDQNKTDENTITNCMNNIHEHLEFKLTTEENNKINCLDLSIHRNNQGLQIGIYRKPTQTQPYILHPTTH
jgi:uncharacterized protein (UPF0297 family)